MRPVIGIDLSLTSTGIATFASTGTIRSTRRGLSRLHEISNQVLAMARLEPDTLVVLEGYAYGRPQQAAHLGELGGVVRYRLWRRDISFIDVPPATLKKYATGVGNAPKERVLAEAIRRLDYAGSSHDEADALWLRAIGCELLDPPLVAMPALNRAALATLRDALPASKEPVS